MLLFVAVGKEGMLNFAADFLIGIFSLSTFPSIVKLTFQSKIASSGSTLPIVCIVAALIWYAFPGETAECRHDGSEFGLWHLVPHTEWLSIGFAAGATALAVYLLAELNNSQALLRISSRMLSSVLALLCATYVGMHCATPGHVLMLTSLASLFPLMASHQNASPPLTFVAHLMLSVGSLVMPKVLVFVPFYWSLQIFLRAFSFRCFVASLLAVAMPYWFFFGITFGEHSIDVFVRQIEPLWSWQWYDYSQLTLDDCLPLAYYVLLFVIGVIDFVRNSFLDKTRTRSLYQVVLNHGLFTLAFICLQPQYAAVVTPVFIVDTAIMFGHFFALSYSRLSHIISIVVMLLGIALCLRL